MKIEQYKDIVKNNDINKLVDFDVEELKKEELNSLINNLREDIILGFSAGLTMDETKVLYYMIVIEEKKFNDAQQNIPEEMEDDIIDFFIKNKDKIMEVNK